MSNRNAKDSAPNATPRLLPDPPIMTMTHIENVHVTRSHAPGPTDATLHVSNAPAIALMAAAITMTYLLIPTSFFPNALAAGSLSRPGLSDLPSAERAIL